MSHTPIPWTSGKRGPNNCPIIGHDGLLIAMLPSGNDFQEEAESNEQFILKACNSHEALLEALKAMVHFAHIHEFPAEITLIQYNALIAKIEAGKS